MTTTNSRQQTLSWAGFALVAVSLGATQWKLIAAQTFFGLAALLWLGTLLANRRRPDYPPFFIPLLVYAAFTLISAAFSGDPRASFVDSKQLVLFLMVPVVAMFARGDRAARVVDVIIALGAASAVVGILQSGVFGYNTLDTRPVGPLSHWMTFSGVLMLATGAAVARLLFVTSNRTWPAIAVPALLAALVLSLTRNAYLGTAAAVCVLMVVRNWRLLLILPIAGLILLLIAPGLVMARISSIGDPNNLSNRDRMAMLRMGVHMVQDHPLTGVGPEMVQRVYEQYRDPLAVNPTNPHLHNVPMQIAAERGLPALAIWLWFVVVAFRDLWRQLTRGPAKAVAGAGVAAMVAMLVAGLFEYNFGDSEFLMLFLGLITLPWAAARPETESGTVTPAAEARA